MTRSGWLRLLAGTLAVALLPTLGWSAPTQGSQRLRSPSVTPAQGTWQGSVRLRQNTTYPDPDDPAAQVRTRSLTQLTDLVPGTSTPASGEWIHYESAVNGAYDDTVAGRCGGEDGQPLLRGRVEWSGRSTDTPDPSYPGPGYDDGISLSLKDANGKTYADPGVFVGQAATTPVCPGSSSASRRIYASAYEPLPTRFDDADRPLVDTDPDPNHLKGTTTFTLAAFPYSHHDVAFTYYFYELVYDLHRSEPPCPDADTVRLEPTDRGGIGATDVAFHVAGQSVPGATYVLDTGDRTDDVSSGTGQPDVVHHYASGGEYGVRLVVAEPSGCSIVIDQTVVADPVTTYAPAFVLSQGERYFPDSVDIWLQHATLVQDLPNLGATATRLDERRCPDRIVGLGKYANARANRSIRPHVRLSSRALVVSRLGRPAGRPYRFHEQRLRRSRCLERPGVVSSATSTAARKSSGVSSTDDGLVLSGGGMSAAGAAKVRAGDRSLGRTPVYVDYQPGRSITYWLWFAYSGWRERSGRHVLTERQQGTWAHVSLRLHGAAPFQMAAFFQHQGCQEQMLAHDGVRMTSGTHPEVFVSRASHTVLDSPSAAGSGSCVDHLHGGEATRGTTLRSWAPTTSGRSRLRPISEQPWTGFQGMWGDPVASTTAQYGDLTPGASKRDLPEGW